MAGDARAAADPAWLAGLNRAGMDAGPKRHGTAPIMGDGPAVPLVLAF